ncbi:MAG: glycerate kinase [Ignavibacteriaceae bacterium]
MHRTILVAPNSYKECADSVQAAHLFEKYLNAENKFKIIKKPISDGGDGFLNVCKSILNLKLINYSVSSPIDNFKINCTVGLDEKSSTLFIESSDIIGLKLVPVHKRNPLLLTTKGLGELLSQINQEVLARKYNVKRVVIGVGGTCTNDLALGICSVFGLKLLDTDGNSLELLPRNYSKAVEVIWKGTKLQFDIEVVVDVDNPIIGPQGSAKVFAKQKGASDSDIEILENGFIHILNILKEKKLINFIEELNGAGGGLAAGLTIFFSAKTKKSDEFVKNDLGLASIEEPIDIIITGEGAFDGQSLMNKGTGILLNLFMESDIPVYLCCGVIEHNVKALLPQNIRPIELVNFFSGPQESITKFEKGIQLACLKIIEDYISSNPLMSDGDFPSASSTNTALIKNF